ncbi:4-coumarate--CoA ligase-like 1 [Abeliophyllum distichum]|uniref:4-coumarate--CoA ligase-like 1 n=1 Tax=Abeliophyllum distichum TaxID=126358 RepID=A0ABD1SGM4_9LAMI
MENGAQSFAQDEIIFRSKYTPVQVPEDQTLPEFVLSNAEPYLDKVAFVDALTGKGYNYGEVIRDVKRFAKALRSLGLRKGHVVVVVLPNISEYAIIALGIMAAGGVFSGANPNGLSSEIKKQVEAADAKLIVTDGSTYDKVKVLGLPVIIQGEDRVEGTIHWDELLEAADRANTGTIDEKVHQTDLCALPFSSGTTGLSKGVMLTHRNLVANLCSSLFSVGPELIGQNPIVDEFDLSKLKLRSVMTAAAPLAPEILTEFEKKFPGVEVQEAYGMTEHSCITLTHGDPNKGHGIAKRNSVGFILPNLEVKFIDPETGRSLPKDSPGEICVRSQCVMKGYYKNEYETALTIDKEGWLHTGDIGYIDDDGDVFLVDRIKELIKYKGFQVAPAELEAILLSHHSVEDAAVVGLPNKEAGEIPAACVVISSKAKESEEDIMNYVASNVATYKRIRILQFVDIIPKSTSGKIMRRLVKENMVKNL